MRERERCVCVCVYIYIYVYIYRERERADPLCVLLRPPPLQLGAAQLQDQVLSGYIYIYIYMYSADAAVRLEELLSSKSCQR